MMVIGTRTGVEGRGRERARRGVTATSSLMMTMRTTKEDTGEEEDMPMITEEEEEEEEGATHSTRNTNAGRLRGTLLMRLGSLAAGRMEGHGAGSGTMTKWIKGMEKTQGRHMTHGTQEARVKESGWETS